MDGVEGRRGLVVEGRRRRRRGEGGGIIFRGFLIQEVKLAGAPAGERQGGGGR